MIHELGSIPCSKQKGSPMNCIEWEAFIGKGGRKNKVSREGWIASDEVTFLWGRVWVY